MSDDNEVGGLGNEVPKDQAEVVLTTFAEQANITVAWKVREGVDRGPAWEEARPDETQDAMVVEIPEELLLQLCKAATIGALAAADLGIEMPLSIAGTENALARLDELQDDHDGIPKAAIGLMGIFNNPDEAEQCLSMAVMVAGVLSMEGWKHQSEGTMADFLKELDSVPTYEKEGN